jgi:hypothetical protein
VDPERRKAWNGEERRGCYFDPKQSAVEIAAHLDAIATARRAANERDKNERVGRYVTSWEFALRSLRVAGVIGAPILAWLHGAGKISLSLFSAG